MARALSPLLALYLLTQLALLPHVIRERRAAVRPPAPAAAPIPAPVKPPADSTARPATHPAPRA